MHYRLTVASLYANAYGRRAAQTVKKTTNKVAEEITSHNARDLMIATAVLGGVALTARVAGFKAGYKFANSPDAI